MVGFEPTTFHVSGECSNQLSYIPLFFGRGSRCRTCRLLVPNQASLPKTIPRYFVVCLTKICNHFHSHNTFVIFFCTEYGFRTHLTILMRDSSFPLSLGVSAEDVGFEPTQHISVVRISKPLYYHSTNLPYIIFFS